MYTLGKAQHSTFLGPRHNIRHFCREKLSSDSNYVRITGQNTGCWSYVGKRGGQQLLNLQPNGCMSSRTIQHEFMHAIGMYHMQSRPDRDQYVTIHFDNIQSGKEHNFQLLSNTLTFDTEYNARSFMHYPWWGFAIDGSKPTISSKVSRYLLLILTNLHFHSMMFYIFLCVMSGILDTHF